MIYQVPEDFNFFLRRKGKSGRKRFFRRGIDRNGNAIQNSRGPLCGRKQEKEGRGIPTMRDEL